MPDASTDEPWFRQAVLYQIYPRSFYDSNNDGIGDLNGITKKLNYLSGDSDSLGVSAIWISPFYPSPMADFGYDVSDYRGVDPIFGTLDDFKRLLKAAHQHHLKVIIDFVPNHTSDEHPWFKEARMSRDNPKRHWYVWRDPADGGSPPNNWLSEFGGPAWHYDESTGQYYLHSFLAKQPDLNWDNPEVRKAMNDSLRFWLDMGVDGFRVDAVLWLSKDPDWRDDPPHPDYHPDRDDPTASLNPIYSRRGPHLFEYLHEMAETIRAYPDTFMVTEAYPRQWDNTDAYLHFYENIDPEVSAPFNFEAISSPWDAKEFKHIIDNFQSSLKDGYLPIYCFGNHDQPRLAGRHGGGAARTAAMLQLTLPGMPVIYYGDELGMTDGEVPPNKVQDPFEKQVPGKGLGRDPERTPLLWNNKKNAGFTKGEPWLPVNPNYVDINIERQQIDPKSSLNLYRSLLKLRASSRALYSGDYSSLKTPDNVFGFHRQFRNERIKILLNFSDQTIALPLKLASGKPLLSTYLDRQITISQLRPNEGIILKD